jgi:hypothetical protein
MSPPEISSRVLEFLARRIDTVPQLEALLLLWQAPDQWWRAEDVAARLYVSLEEATAILRALQLRQLAELDDKSARYRYSAAWDESGTEMSEVADAYRRQLIQMTRIIHAGASAAVRNFARAFSFKDER